MIRWSTFLWIGAVILSATVVFQLKYNVQDLENRLRNLEASTQTNKEAIRVLQAEWSYLNKPERLAHLAKTYLSYEAMKPIQVSSFDTIGPRPEDFGYTIAAAHPEPRSRPENLFDPLSENTAIAMAVLENMQAGQDTADLPAGLGDKVTYISSELPLFDSPNFDGSNFDSHNTAHTQSIPGVMAASFQVPLSPFEDIDLIEVSDTLTSSGFPLHIQRSDIWSFARPLVTSRSIALKGNGQ